MRRRIIVPALALLLAASGAAPATSAPQPDWSHAARLDVALSSFKFAPATLQLKAGQPVILHLANTGSGGHNFSAPAFFRAASVRPQDAGKIKDGTVDVAGHESVDVAIVPAAGQYPLRCTHTLHSTFGMKGSIVVR